MSRNQDKRTKIINRGNEKGFTLVEVLVAISILTFGLLAVASMQIASIMGNSRASEVTEGTTWATDKLETLIRLAAVDYNDSALTDDDADGNGGLDDEGDDADHEDPPQGNYNIYWNISIDGVIPDTKTVSVIVTWLDRGSTKRVRIQHIIPEI